MESFTTGQTKKLPCVSAQEFLQFTSLFIHRVSMSIIEFDSINRYVIITCYSD